MIDIDIFIFLTSFKKWMKSRRIVLFGFYSKVLIMTREEFEETIEYKERMRV